MMAAYVFVLLAAVYAAPNMRPRSRDYAAAASIFLAAVVMVLDVLEVLN